MNFKDTNKIFEFLNKFYPTNSKQEHCLTANAHLMHLHIYVGGKKLIKSFSPDISIETLLQQLQREISRFVTYTKTLFCIMDSDADSFLDDTLFFECPRQAAQHTMIKNNNTESPFKILCFTFDVCENIKVIDFNNEQTLAFEENTKHFNEIEINNIRKDLISEFSQIYTDPKDYDPTNILQKTIDSTNKTKQTYLNFLKLAGKIAMKVRFDYNYDGVEIPAYRIFSKAHLTKCNFELHRQKGLDTYTLK